MSSQETAKRGWWRPEALALGTALILRAIPASAVEYRENFDAPGKPEAPAGLVWSYRAELCPAKTWIKMMPGDGYAYFSVLRSRLESRKKRTAVWPFQTLQIGPVTPGHRLSMRARDAVIPGLASMIFTHRQKETLDEIDIEIVAEDTDAPATGHPTGPDRGWTDTRLNTYARAGAKTLVPSRRLQKPIIDAMGSKVSHRDGKFHTYAIEWRRHAVRFMIDGVEQAVVADVVPQGSADLIFGLRQMPWAGEPDWNEDYRTMLVDWIAIEPLEAD